MSKRIRRGRAPTDLPVKDPPIAQDFLIATDYTTQKLIRIPLSAIDTGGGGGEYSAGDGLNLSGSTFSVDTSVVRTDRQIIAGPGLSGGGNLGSNVTLSLDPVAGVVTIADNQTITGTKTFNGNLVMGTSAATIRRATGVGQLSIQSTQNSITGASIRLFGTGGTTPEEGRLRSASTDTLTWDANGVTLTTAGRITNSAADTWLTFSGGTTHVHGGNVICYGQSYSSKPNTVELRANATVRATANAAGFTFTAPSDRRIKAGIKPMAGLDIVRRLNPVSFRFNHAYRSRAANKLDDRERYGFIAQEYREVFPDAVEESEEVFNGAKTLQMTSQDALPAAVAAIKELDAEVQALKAELARLKGEPS